MHGCASWNWAQKSVTLKLPLFFFIGLKKNWRVLNHNGCFWCLKLAYYKIHGIWNEMAAVGWNKALADYLYLQFNNKKAIPWKEFCFEMKLFMHAEINAHARVLAILHLDFDSRKKKHEVCSWTTANWIIRESRFFVM